MTLRDTILRHTEIAPARLCPEIRLHLVTARCPLFRATEDEAAQAGLVEPYWAFCWAGGQALARYVLDNPEQFAGRNILDFGAGGAVEGIAAALAGASVLAADIDAMAVEAARLNAELAGVALQTTTEDLVGRLDGRWDVVLAGDVSYEKEMAEAATDWLNGLARRGATVLIGDPRRAYLALDRLESVAEYGVPVTRDLEDSEIKRTGVFRFR